MGWLLVFLICLSLLLSLPMLPALLEWHRKSDASPLKVVREYDGNIAHFAARFRQFLVENISLPESDEAAVGLQDKIVDGVLKNGYPYQIVGQRRQPEFDEQEQASNATSRLIVAQGALDLPTGMFFETEMYAAQGISGGNWTVLRAILADGDVNLGEGCDIMRWAHSAGSMAFGAGSRLYGRISAEGAIQLARKTIFGRMHAPCIRFGAAPAPAPAAVVERMLGRVRRLQQPQRLLDDAAGRWLVAGNWLLPDASFHRGSLVVMRDLTIGRGCFILGDVKGRRRLRLEGNLRIDGALVGADHVEIGPGSIVKGPVVGEREVVIRTGTVIGTVAHPTTVTAPVIRIEEGVTIHGTVWARDEGYVIASGAAEEGPA